MYYKSIEVNYVKHVIYFMVRELNSHFEKKTFLLTLPVKLNKM